MSLVEVLVVVAILAALAGAAVSLTEVSPSDRLQRTADMLAADLELVQELAISRGAPHCATFEGAERRFVVKHTGANGAYHALPRYVRTHPQETTTKATYSLDDRSPYGKYVAIAGFEPASLYLNDEFPVEFSADGALTDGRTATIWLSSTNDGDTRYLPVRIYAVTGVVSIGTTTAILPATVATVEDED